MSGETMPSHLLGEDEPCETCGSRLCNCECPATSETTPAPEVARLIEDIDATFADDHGPSRVDVKSMLQRLREALSSTASQLAAAQKYALQLHGDMDALRQRAEQAEAREKEAKAELTLVREAACDEALSDGAARAVARGLVPPTPEDVEWARSVLSPTPATEPQP